ncbi:unnamed protein product [Linum trigynum]|uniref:Uncharacterized protein n=1 Tax=Linum trigynum TaxID=586398 RepID=A0AAV2G0R0_9ROSI
MLVYPWREERRTDTEQGYNEKAMYKSKLWMPSKQSYSRNTNPSRALKSEGNPKYTTKSQRQSVPYESQNREGAKIIPSFAAAAAVRELRPCF